MINQLLNKVDPISKSIYTEWQHFKTDDLTRFKDLLDERLHYLSEPFIKFISSEEIFVSRDNIRLSNFFNTKYYKLLFDLIDEETGEVEQQSVSISCPLLIKNNEFIFGGSRFSLILSLSANGNIHSRKKVIFKMFEEMFVLDVTGKPAFLLPKRFGIFSAFLLTNLSNGLSFEETLISLIPGAKIMPILSKKEEKMISKTQLIKFKDFVVVTPPLYNKVSLFYFKSLETIRRNSLSELSEYTVAYNKLVKVLGSITSRKIKTNISDLTKFITKIGIEEMKKEIAININKEYSDTQLASKPVFSETLVNTIQTTLYKQILSYKNSPNRNINKLRRVLNEQVLFDLIINALYNDSRLRYIDSSNAYQQDLNVSLSRQSGSAVSSTIRNITDDYRGKLSLHYVVAGKSAGLTSQIAPV